MSNIQLLLMSSGVSRLLQLLAGLSFLVVLHEFGHYFFARLFKTRVEKFYLFFDFMFPFSGLLNFSLFKIKKGDCEYGIGWFPLGGYVKIAGMIDESMDKDALAAPPEPWEYRSKKPYQRLFIMLGGIIMNIIVAIVLYGFIFSKWGEQYLSLNKMPYGVAVDSIGQSIGLKSGDRIRGVDGKKLDRFEQIPLALILHNENGTVEITRNGKDTVISIPHGIVDKIIKKKRADLMIPRLFAVVDSVGAVSIANTAGMKKNDSIIAVNGQPVQFWDQVSVMIKGNYGKPLTFTFVRNGAIDSVTATIPKDSTFGTYYPPRSRYYTDDSIRYGLFDGMARGFTYSWDQFIVYVSQFKLFFNKEVNVNDSLGGFGSMAKMYAPVFDWKAFLLMTAFISIALAFMNLLPIPGLDGGYVLFLLFEMISGRKVSERVMEISTTVGLVLLLAMMVYFNGLDVLRWLHLKH